MNACRLSDRAPEDRTLPTNDYDYFVIGAGSGGVRSARVAAQLGARVGICEDDRLGGTCVNVGCVPKKLLVYGASYAEHLEDAAGFGWTVGPSEFSWPALIAAKDREITRLNQVYDRLLRSAGVDVLRGRGRLLDAHTVQVGDRTVTAEHLLVATGSRPFLPELPGKQHLRTSDAVFSLPELPRRVVIVGGGYIGVELAGIFAALGTHTTLIDRNSLPLRGFDDDVRAFLAAELEKKRVHLRPDAHVACVEARADGAYDVVLANLESLTADLVLYATGRVPNTAGLGLEAVGVQLGKRGGIVVDADYTSSVPSVHAVGDVTDRLMLTPVAINEGMALARRLFGGPAHTVDYRYVPTAVFSQPQVGTVGLSEAEARRQHGKLRIYRSSFRPMKATLSGRDEHTLMKLVVDDQSDRVLGVHVVGPEAGEIVQGFAVALTCGATKAQLDHTVGIHPTAAEELVTMRTPEPDRG